MYLFYVSLFDGPALSSANNGGFALPLCVTQVDGDDGEPLEILPNVPEGLVILGANDTNCVVCWERAASLAFVPCGHACVCWNAQCSSLKKCPLCRSEATQLCKVSAVQTGDLTELRSKTSHLNSKASGSSHDLDANDPETIPSTTNTTAQAASNLTSVTTEVYAESASSDPEPTDDEESPPQSN